MRRLIALALLLAPLPALAEPCALSPRETVTRFLDLFYTQHKVREAFMTYVDPGYIQHNPFAASGRDAAIAFLEPFAASHPDQSAQIKRIIADGDIVAAHVHVKWTKDERGAAVVDLFRVKDCKVVEHWDVFQPIPEKAANANTMF